jgi:hypothetical protein
LVGEEQLGSEVGNKWLFYVEAWSKQMWNKPVGNYGCASRLIFIRLKLCHCFCYYIIE